MPQFITEKELGQIKALTHYLNESGAFKVGEGLAVDAKLTDANGDDVGTIQITEDGAYGLVLPS